MSEEINKADRYARQRVLPQIGEQGQTRLGEARVLLVGCGALGTNLAELLVRAGVGFLRIVDRDLVEMSNLQRQVLFDEEDAREGLPKAVAAGRRLGEINSEVVVETIVVDVNPSNVKELLEIGPSPLSSPSSSLSLRAEGRSTMKSKEEGEGRVDLILDGTDNVATRYLMNDVAVKHGIDWVYGACVGVSGRVMGVRPKVTACLRCLFPEPPNAGELPTCDTAGVLGPAAAVVAAWQAATAIRFLVDEDAPGGLLSLDVWHSTMRRADSARQPQGDCPCCGRGEFPFLEARAESYEAALCGRKAVQVQPGKKQRIDLEAAAKRWEGAGEIRKYEWFVKCRLGEPAGVELTLFGDGRLLVGGTTDVMRAKSLYARFVGS